MNSSDHKPDSADLHVGNRIRMCRRAKGLSQEGLAAGLGLTFQQVQKYERGANRVSASKLLQVARTLEVPVAYFFDGLAGANGPDDLGDARMTDAAMLGAVGDVPALRRLGELPRWAQNLVGALINGLAKEAAEAEPA